MTRQALGRGLRALIPQAGAYEGDEVREVPVDQIEPNPYQPRRYLDPEALRELADSIRVHGLLEPVLVRPVPAASASAGWGAAVGTAGGGEGQALAQGRFQLIAGERRWRAAMLAGLERVPAVVRPMEDRQAMQVALVENLQREDLNPIEEAEAYRRLIEEFGMTQDEVAQVVGKKRPTVANALRLLNLEEEIQGMVARGELSAGHAKVVAGLSSWEERLAACREVQRRELSVRELEDWVRRRMRAAPGGARPPRSRRPEVAQRSPEWGAEQAAVVEALERALGTRVRLEVRNGRGRLEVEFYSLGDLDRIVELLLGSEGRERSAGRE